MNHTDLCGPGDSLRATDRARFIWLTSAIEVNVRTQQLENGARSSGIQHIRAAGRLGRKSWAARGNLGKAGKTE